LDGLGSATLDRVIQIAGTQSGIPKHKLSATSAIYQDVRMAGDDVNEFVERLQRELGCDAYQWPWTRFTNLSEPTILSLPHFVWQLFTWAKRGSFHDYERYERLNLGHIAAVIDCGEWFEP
jgi:hypothetical protein